MDALDWQELFSLSMSPLEIMLRGTFMYWLLFLLFRFVARRDIGSVGIADLLIIVIVADAAQNGMAGDADSLVDAGLLGSVHIYERPEGRHDGDKGEVTVGEFVISSCDATEMLDTVKKAFDQIALTVQHTVITTLNLAVRAWWNDGFGSTGANAFDKGIRVIALVCDDRLEAQSVDQLLRARNIGHLSFGKNQSQRSTKRIHSQMNLGAQSSARSPESLGSVFFRAPAECWCARMTVESISTCSTSPPCASTWATRSQTPLRRQREKRMYAVCHRPNSLGKSRHGLPVRAIHSTASTNNRLSAPCRPTSPTLPGTMDSRRSHISSLSNIRLILIAYVKDEM
ncbi:hypothetical protein B0G84_8568 [Paraburkholderia sp. BL8N3]|nr:hypothetical protein B0G84_8568 [Paraburkholderia sp. BL8N3]